MKLSLLKFKTNNYLKRNKSQRVSLPYKQAMKIGIIFTVEDKMKHDRIKDFIKRMEQEGKQVKVMSFLPNDKQNYEFLFDFFTEKELSFWGSITSDIALSFADTPFDFLYYFDADPNTLILNLIAKSKAKCRIGKYWEGSQLFFEMMIESNDNSKGLIDLMDNYTRKLA